MLTKEILAIKGNAVYTIPPEGRLTEAVNCMVDYDIGSLVVMEHGKLVGMLSFREVLSALDEGKGSLGDRRVSEVMVKDPPVVGPEMELDDLRRSMLESHARYMPVLDKHVLIGVLSFHDVAKAVLEEQSFENDMLKGYIKNWPA